MNWKLLIGTVAILISLSVVSPVHAQFLEEDERCAAGLIASHIAHEWGHDFAAIAAGGHPWRPVAVWGDKWNESQKKFRFAALGGFISQHLFSVFNAATSEDSFSRCVLNGDEIISMYYAARVKFTPNDPGDYSPFSISKRREITMINVGFSLFLEELARVTEDDRQWTSAHISVFNFNTIFRGQ